MGVKGVGSPLGAAHKRRQGRKQNFKCLNSSNRIVITLEENSLEVYMHFSK